MMVVVVAVVMVVVVEVVIITAAAAAAAAAAMTHPSTSYPAQSQAPRRLVCLTKSVTKTLALSVQSVTLASCIIMLYYRIKCYTFSVHCICI